MSSPEARHNRSRSRSRRSSVLPDGRRSSLIALENAALETHSRRSSIGGRLGGSITVPKQHHHDQQELRALMKEYDAEVGADVGEGSPLVGKSLLETELESDPAPALLVWIFPALACATCCK